MSDASHGGRAAGPRLIALIGPFQCGKTTLFESILAHAGAVPRQGSVTAGTSLGDASAEARAHKMSVEANVGHAVWLGDHYTFVDLPGSGTEPDDVVVLQAELQRLSYKQRASIVLHDYAGYPARDIANMIGSTEAAVRVHVMRARRALRARLASAR